MQFYIIYDKIFSQLNFVANEVKKWLCFLFLITTVRETGGKEMAYKQNGKEMTKNYTKKHMERKYSRHNKHQKHSVKKNHYSSIYCSAHRPGRGKSAKKLSNMALRSKTRVNLNEFIGYNVDTDGMDPIFDKIEYSYIGGKNYRKWGLGWQENIDLEAHMGKANIECFEILSDRDEIQAAKAYIFK